jgi:hypothetical protein
MDRAMSMPMFRGQLAVPPLGYADDDRSYNAVG